MGGSGIAACTAENHDHRALAAVTAYSFYLARPFAFRALPSLGKRAAVA